MAPLDEMETLTLKSQLLLMQHTWKLIHITHFRSLGINFYIVVDHYLCEHEH